MSNATASSSSADADAAVKNGNSKTKFNFSMSLLDMYYFNLNKIFRIFAEKQSIDPSDLGGLDDPSLEDARVSSINPIFEEKWNEEKNNYPANKRSLFRVLIKTVGIWPFLVVVFLNAVVVGLSFAIPQLTSAISNHQAGISRLSPPIYHLLIALMFICPFLGAICQSRFSMNFGYLQSKIGASLISKIYNKCLNVGSSSKHSAGMLATLYTTDVTNVKTFPTMVMTLIFAPAQAAIALGLIYNQVGISMFVGLACSIGIFPLSSFVIYFMNEAIKTRREYQSERVKLTTDIINGIKIAKYYSWEFAFQTAINKFREMEIFWNKRVMFSFSISSLIADGIPLAQPILVFYTYIKLGNSLTFSKAFVTIMLFNILKNPIAALSAMISTYFTAQNSVDKILEFLNVPDTVEYVITDSSIDDGKTAIKFENVKMGWLMPEEAKEESDKLKKAEEAKAKKSENMPKTNVKNDVKYEAVAATEHVEIEEVNRHVNTLNDISFTVKKGELFVITGHVGAGKTSILKGLINGLKLFEGKVYRDGSISYHAQQPWILNTTVKENILFGREEDKELLEKCLDLSCLNADLASFTNGLNTEIGDKGVTLSGGQKARISFARALYRNADIVILDDPLSAVDSSVGRKMFSEGIVNYLCGQGKTVLLVTHQVHLLSNCKSIIVIDAGKIVAQGPYLEVEKHIVAPEEAADLITTTVTTTNIVASADKQGEEKSNTDTSAPTSGSMKSRKSISAEPKKDETKDNKKLVQEEKKFTGTIPLSVYTFYMERGAPFVFVCSLICIVGFMTAQILASFWLAAWGNREAENYVKTGDPLSKNESMMYLKVYAIILMIGVGMNYFKVLLGIVHAVNATRSFHAQLVTAVLNAPSYWFDITPTGRIITRFTSDLELLGFVHYLMWYSFTSFCGVIASIITICITTKGSALILLVPLCIAYYFLFIKFSNVTTDLTRVESLCQSPININFMQTINGIDSIKAYKESDKFFSKISKATDSLAVAFLTKTQTFQWLSIRLDTFGAVLSFAITLLTALTLENQFIPPAQLALAMVFVIQLPTQLTSFIQTLSVLGNMMSSVQRLKDYIDDVPDESEYLSNIKHINRSEKSKESNKDVTIGTEMVKIKSVVKPPPEWPSKGVIESEDLQLGYYGGPDILKGVTFLSKPREKIGVIGRTGSGKSTLVTALFHIELVRGGKIFIDGIDIATVDIHHLRSKLCIIPQDPVMFVGNVRYNLDPFNVFKDEEIWDVLAKTRMKHDVEHLPHKLLEPVAEGGSNFSVGQRQLICFARALLKKPRILVLDEATASVDNETDSHVQQMIRELFKDCTVLTIAHRLNTIVDSDRIMVLGQGKVVEFDSPKALLDNPDSHFAKMWNDFKKEHETH